MLHPSEILRPKTNKAHGNSTWFLISPPENPLAIFSIPLEIPYPYHPCFFSGIVQYRCMNLPKTDDNDRAHKNDAIPYPGILWYRSNSSHLFWNLKKTLC